MNMPPPPPGFELESGGIPPPPTGFEMESAAKPPPPPPGFVMDTEPPKGSPWSVSRGFISSLTQQNPESFADFLEGFSHDAPEFLAGSMRGASQKVRDWSKDITPEGYERLTNSMYDVKDAGQAFDWAMETIGSGVGSTLPTLGVGAAGAVTGAGVGGPVGAVVGGVGGAGAASYAQNYGEVYKALKDEKIDPKTAHDYAKKWAVPIAALDVASLGTIVSRFGGAAAAKRELTKSLARRIATEISLGTATEASTEALQELGKELAITHATTSEIGAPKEGVGWKMLEAGVAGGLTGGVMAGPAGVRSGTAVRPGTEEEAYAATVPPETSPAPTEAIPPTASATPTPGPLDPLPPSPTEMAVPTNVPAPAGPTTTTTQPEIDKIIPVPPEMEPAPQPAVVEQQGLYRGAFGPRETQKMLTRNLQRLINYQIALADPEVQRLPDQIKHLQEQLPVLQQEIIEQRQFLGVTAPSAPQPKLLPPPPSITPEEMAAGIEQPPRDLGPAPVIINVPEEVNIAAARITQSYPQIPYESSVEEFLGKPVDLTNEQTRAVAANWGLLRYVLYDSVGKRVHTTGTHNISPGQEPTGVRLKVSQDDVDPRNVILHSNIAVNPTGAPLGPDSPRVDIVEAATAKFGQRFHDYVYAMGQHFMAVRNAVASIPGPTVPAPFRGAPKDYVGLLSEGIGISFVTDAHGISIRAPIAASFINIGMPKSTDPREAAHGFVYTMLHELSHHTHRSETRIDDVVSEMMDHLIAHPTFDARTFLKGLTATVTQHHDVMLWLRGMYEDGNVEAIGERLPVGRDQERGGRGPGDLGNLADRTGREWGSKISDWAKIGPSRTGGVVDGKVGSATLTRVGGSSPDYGLAANARALRAEVGHSDVDAYQQTGATAPIRAAVGRVFGGNIPPSVQAQAAHADRINWLYEYSAGLLELLQANKWFTPLIKYTEVVRLMHIEESRAQDAGVTIAKKWRSLGTKNGDILFNFEDALANMVYLTPQERQQGITRHPSPQEFAQLAARHKMNPRTMGVHRDIMKHLDVSLTLQMQNAMDEAQRLLTGPALIRAVNEIQAATAKLRSKPYFPFMRFGTHFITVRDPVTNGVEFFELYDRKGLKSAKKVQAEALAKLRRQFPTYPDSAFKWGVMPPDASSLYGLSPTLLNHMKQKMQLSTAQLDVLQQLQYQLSPALSFKHRFQHKSYAPGYSRDFLRAFSHYSFHSARYYARTKYIWELEEQVKAAGQVNGDKASRIRNYMEDHLQNTILNIKGDHGLLKGFAFFMHMGFMASSAFYNLYSLPTNAFAHFAKDHGNARTTKAMLKAIAQVSTFYQRGNLYGATDFQMRALGYGILSGRVSETQAAELAALANGNGLMYGIGGNKVQRGAHFMMEKSAYLFENVEQFIRRITYRAALDLATNDPRNRGVQEAVRFSPREHQNLVAGVNTGPSRRTFSPQEASSILYANEAVDQSAFVYHRWAKPRIMRGKWSGQILIFYRFMQAVVFSMLNGNRGYNTRLILMTVLMGGLYGLPGWEELKSMIQAMLKYYGHNVNVDTELSKLILQWTDGTVPPDILLHGLARRGFGIPAMLDGIGSWVTGRPGRGFADPGPGQNVSFPMLDLSKGMTPRLLPVDIGKLVAPYQDTSKVISETVERGSGAALSPFFNIYKAIMNSKMEPDDYKRWEKAVPRALGAASKALRVYSEERERAPRGGPAGAKTQLDYDVRDTEQLMEIMFQGLGFTTLRQSREWDFTKAKIEHTAFVKGSRQGIMEQFYEAVMSQDEKEMDSVRDDIEKYNARVKGTPDAAYAITAEGLRTSLRNRIQEKTLDEAGLAREKRQIPVIQDLREVYPKAVSDKVIDVQRR